jgi:hypothetical protein
MVIERKFCPHLNLQNKTCGLDNCKECTPLYCTLFKTLTSVEEGGKWNISVHLSTTFKGTYPRGYGKYNTQIESGNKKSMLDKNVLRLGGN